MEYLLKIELESWNDVQTAASYLFTTIIGTLSLVMLFKAGDAIWLVDTTIKQGKLLLSSIHAHVTNSETHLEFENRLLHFYMAPYI